MEVNAWCGRCGQRFALAEVITPPYAGHCPRCGEAFAADYIPVVVSTVHTFARAAEELVAAGAALADMAPRLHIDADHLAQALHTSLDQERAT